MMFALRVVPIVLLASFTIGTTSSESGPPVPPTVTEAQVEGWKKDLSNWGRWGTDDEIGALNLITPAKRRQAANLVRDGVTISLAADADTVMKEVDNPQPYEHAMIAVGSDRLAVAYHGIAHTHLDSLAHIDANGVFYNGYQPARDLVVKEGQARNAIQRSRGPRRGSRGPEPMGIPADSRAAADPRRNGITDQSDCDVLNRRRVPPMEPSDGDRLG